MDFESFGPYLVYECLGAGGMATVHRATKAIGAGVLREVALKRLLPQLAGDKTFVEDFIREAKLAAQLDHPNIVHILELGEVDGTYFIAMELVRGASLATLMKHVYATKQTAPIGVALAILSDLCDALDYASAGRGLYGQRLQIIHRDLTPSNLIVTDEGRVKIIDFGVAKAMSGKFMTNTGMIKGKLGYMSVEALSGGKAVDARTDLFSLGVVAWELLTGRRLFRGVNEYEVITKIRSGEILPPSAHDMDIPDELDAIVLKALAREREDRWEDAATMRAALDVLRSSYRASAAQIAEWKDRLVPRATPRPQAGLAEGSVRQISHTDTEMVITAVRANAAGDATRRELPAHRRADTEDDEATTFDPVATNQLVDDRD